MSGEGKVHAVLVSYHPGAEIRDVIAAVPARVERVWVIDNASGPTDRALLRDLADEAGARLALIENQTNIGLATAQNQGIARALAAGAAWVLLLDQDSIAAPDMVDRLLEGLRGIPQPERVGLLAPALEHRDHAGRQRYLSRRGGWRTLAGDISPPLAFVIASGGLVRATALRAVGGMADGLFIDYIDVEFGLRLNRAGWTIHVVAAARLRHRLGSPTVARLFGRDFVLTNHSPRRRFTIHRNRALLWRATGWRFPAWLAFDLVAAITDIGRIAALERNRRAKLAAVARGLAAGLFGPLAKTLRPGSLEDTDHTGSWPRAAPDAPPFPRR